MLESIIPAAGIIMMGKRIFFFFFFFFLATNGILIIYRIDSIYLFVRKLVSHRSHCLRTELVELLILALSGWFFEEKKATAKEAKHTSYSFRG